MAGSPFSKGGGAAVVSPPPAAKAASAKTDLPDTVTNAGEDKPIKADPFANVSDPSGISGYKPLFFMGQLVLMHATETGWMKTTANNAEKPMSEFVRYDIIPLTRPEAGEPTKLAVVDKGDVFSVLNKDGDVETCEPYDAGDRIDDVLVFNAPLVREGKKALDNGTTWVLGRITKGTAKANQSAPVILIAADDDDKALFQEWRASAAKAAQK